MAGKNKSEQVLSDIVEKISFANYLPLLTRATGDNKDATPGYMFTEIEKLSYDFPHHCKQLAAYLSRRLDKPSPHVKLKVLRIFDHLIKEGHVNFRIALRKNDGAIKMSTMYHGVPDPYTGTVLYETIRSNSKMLLEQLFSPEKILEDEKEVDENKQRPEKPFLGALGSTTSTEGKYQGFGNSPIAKEETVTEKVLSYFDKLSTTSDQNAKVIREGIASSVGSYEAVAMPAQHFVLPVAKPMPSLPPPPKPNAMKAHVPGKAGGGWEDSDDEDVKQHSHNASVVSEGSLETAEPMQDNCAERELVHKFCIQDKFPISWIELAEICSGCVQLSGSEIIRALSDEMKTKPSIQSLTLLDALLHTELLATPRSISEAHNFLANILNDIINNENVTQICQNKADKILHVLKCRLPNTCDNRLLDYDT